MIITFCREYIEVSHMVKTHLIITLLIYSRHSVTQKYNLEMSERWEEFNTIDVVFDGKIDHNLPTILIIFRNVQLTAVLSNIIARSFRM